MNLSIRCFATFALLLFAPVPSSAVELVKLTEGNFDEYVVAGKEADANYGDFVLRNDKIAAVIAAPVPTRHANMTVRNVGGCLIDLTRRDAESDQLSCYYPGGGVRFTSVSVKNASAANDGLDSSPHTLTEYLLSEEFDDAIQGESLTLSL